jgi:predicted acyltransferase
MQNSQRLLSLDVFRGITIAGMILVNNPGSWSTVYSPLLHADWHGCTPTDWVFPFFLFIVGVSITLSLNKRKERGDDKGSLRKKIGRRSLSIFGLGLFLAAFPRFGFKEWYPDLTPLHYTHYILLGLLMLSVFYKETLSNEHTRKKILNWGILAIVGIMAVLGFFLYNFSSLRIPGVLQRIAIVYAVVALLFLEMDWKGLLYTGIGLLLAYWALMTLVPIPGGIAPNLEAETNLGAWLDRALLDGHLWSQSKTWDPEGLLSTLPAIVTGISGALVGLWLKAKKGPYETVSGILAMGTILVAIGLTWDMVFPINKKIWTSSYVLYTSGVAMLFLGVIYWLVDILQYKRWTYPFVVYGMNALFVFILSGIFAKLMYYIRWRDAAGELVTAQSWVYKNFYLSIFSDYNASLAYALTNVLLLWLVSLALYKRKIFIKV